MNSFLFDLAKLKDNSYMCMTENIVFIQLIIGSASIIEKKFPTQLLTFYRICRYNSVLFSYFENRGNCLIRYYTLKPHTNVMSSHHFRGRLREER